MQKKATRNKQPTSIAGKVAKQNGERLVPFGSRVEESLDEFVRLHACTARVTKQDILREALMLFKEKHSGTSGRKNKSDGTLSNPV